MRANRGFLIPILFFFIGCSSVPKKPINSSRELTALDSCENLSIQESWDFGNTQIGKESVLRIPISLSNPNLPVSQISMNTKTHIFTFTGGVYPGALPKNWPQEPCGPQLDLDYAINCVISLSFDPLKEAVYTDILQISYLAGDKVCSREVKVSGIGVK